MRPDVFADKTLEACSANGGDERQDASCQRSARPRSFALTAWRQARHQQPLSLKSVVTYPTRPSAIAVKPKSGATPASRMAAARARGWVRSPCQDPVARDRSSARVERNAPGVSSATRRNVLIKATTGPLGGVTWSIASFSRTAVVPHSAEAAIARSVPGRCNSRRKGSSSPVRASSTSSR